MDTEIALLTSGYVMALITLLASIGWLVARALRRNASQLHSHWQSNYARERLAATSHQR